MGFSFCYNAGRNTPSRVRMADALAPAAETTSSDTGHHAMVDRSILPVEYFILGVPVKRRGAMLASTPIHE